MGMGKLDKETKQTDFSMKENSGYVKKKTLPGYTAGK